MDQDRLKHFVKIGDYDVSALAWQLDMQPELWDERRTRTQHATFEQTSDIWVRYRDPRFLVGADGYNQPHLSAYYPAWYRLTAMRPIVFDVMHKVRANMLGGILITRIPPGGKILPHHDRGTWHAEYYDTKVYVPIKANDQCVNYCGDESRVIRVGEAVIFDNQIVHSVENNGDTARVTLIICTRTK